MHVVRHNTPIKQMVSYTVEVKKIIAHNGGNAFVTQKALTVARVFILVYLLSQLGLLFLVYTYSICVSQVQSHVLDNLFWE